jgi:hypothetical protein
MTVPELMTAHDIEDLGIPTLSGRRALELVRNSVIPSDVFVKLGKRILFALDRLISCVAAGARCARLAHPYP